MTPEQKAVNACGTLIRELQQRKNIGTNTAHTPTNFFSCFGTDADHLYWKLEEGQFNVCDWFLALDSSNTAKFIAFFG